MPKIPSHRFHCLLLGLMLAPLAIADDPASRQLRDQRQQLQRFDHEQRVRQWEHRGRLVEDQDVPPPVASTACWQVSGVRLSGHRVLSAQVLDGAVQPQLKPCMGVADINRLLKAITQRYVQAGYPASRPLLARRPTPGAPLDIRIVEGFVESVELADPSQPLSMRGAFPGLVGDPLRLPDLEQGLDQLNRLAAFDVTADVRPGEMQGGTRVIVQPRQVARRWRLGTTYDNPGSESLGAHRLVSTAIVDSPFGQNGLLSLGYTKAAGDALGSSGGPSFHYDVPYGPWSFALNAVHFSNQASTPEKLHTYDSKTRFYQLNVERALWRNQQGMLSTLARLDHKRLLSSFDNAPIANQSPTLTSVELGVNLLWLEGGLWNAYMGVAQGVDWFGADREPPGSAAFKPLHRTYRANLFHLRQGPSRHPWRWQSELNVQYSTDDLPGTEQLALNGDHTVRGFRERFYTGSTGAVWRNTLSYPLPFSWPANFELRPHLGLDHGRTRSAEKVPAHRLTGATLGLNLTFPGNHIRLDYQHPLHASGMRRQDLEPGYWVVRWALTI
ncbi:MAG TPA: ShlB/FhaC/HecB family hemolysin secretion/activation protein [Pseudomonas sp.]|uniref:ShlB/FhaC/HecB family hemolysin secretion/activation protein n=1 Tax=Pseudomonas sp. TaxID=306 RepID=UPI002B48D767|nr:ShlB/FhaC/HecB family hemolysin secretion/activation protein [Pseudomonas sp.]HKS12494.1 ShlB/FhaC/HecB family hemolysin secretion/activation protein [Pseudomonas sp.]